MTVDRQSIPEEFFDITSAMLLVQPEPQFIYAQLMKMAFGAQLDLGAYNAPGLGLGTTGPARGVDAAWGAPYTSAEYDRLTLQPIDPMKADAIIVVDEIGKTGVGQTVRINRPKYGSGGFSEASRVVKSAQQISTTGTDLSSEQVAITVKAYAGPYDVGQAAVAPYAIARLDAMRMVHKAVQLAGRNLQRDYDKWIDAVIVGLLDATTGASSLAGGPTAIWPLGFAADNDIATAGAAPGDAEMLARAEAALKKGNVPRFPNGKYMATIDPLFSYGLKQDPQWTTLAKFFMSTNPIFASYVGTYGGLEVFESTSLSSTANTSSVGVVKHHVFGPGIIGAGVARMPEIMPSTDDNYGELAKIIWITYMAFALFDQRFGLTMRTG
jgi:hypothetical protein